MISQKDVDLIKSYLRSTNKSGNKRIPNRRIQTIYNAIPEGDYCYKSKSVTVDADGRPRMHISTCPLWKLHSDKPKHLNGSCMLTGEQDWAKGSLGILWDMCKTCNIKMGEEYETSND